LKNKTEYGKGALAFVGMLLVALSFHDLAGISIGKNTFGFIDLLSFIAGILLMLNAPIGRRLEKIRAEIKKEPFCAVQHIFVSACTMLAIFGLSYIALEGRVPREILYLSTNLAVLSGIGAALYCWHAKREDLANINALLLGAVVYAPNWTEALAHLELMDGLAGAAGKAALLANIFAYFRLKYSRNPQVTPGEKTNRIRNLAILFALFAVALGVRSAAVNNETALWDNGHHLSAMEIYEKYFPAIPPKAELAKIAHQSMMYYIVAGLKKMTGARLFLLVKIVIAIFSAAAIFPVYMIARDVFENEYAGLAAAMIYAISPIPYELDHSADIFAMPLLLLTVYALQDWTRERTRGKSIIAGILAGVTFLIYPLPGFIAFGSILLMSISQKSSRLLLYGTLAFVLVSSPSLGEITQRVHEVGTPRLQIISTLEPARLEKLAEWAPIGLAMGAAGIAYAIWKKNRRAVLPLGLLSGLLGIIIAENIFKIYIVVMPLRYMLYIMPLLAIFGGYPLAVLLKYCFGETKKSPLDILLILALAWLFISVGAKNADLLEKNEGGISEGDIVAFNWIKENTEKNAVIIADSGHSFWIPYLTKRQVINGRETTETTSQRRQDAATIFETTSTQEAKQLMNKYNAHYIYYSNNQNTKFPLTTMEDKWDSRVEKTWNNAQKGLNKLEKNFKTIYWSDTNGRIRIYEIG